MSSQEFKSKSIMVTDSEVWETFQNTKRVVEEELDDPTYQDVLEHVCEAYTGWSA